MTFHLIGTGNTAWFLAKKLSAAGHICLGLYGRNKEYASLLANEMKCSMHAGLSEIADDADCCLIAITDAAIQDVAARLSFKNTTLVHTAGSIEKAALDSATPNNGVIWPVYSIIKTDIPTHRNIPCVWEASSERAKGVIHEIAYSFSDILYQADSEQRKWLHLTAVISNNFTNHLLAISDEICERHNLPLSLLQPILSQTVERITTTKPVLMQTGPAKRGDDNIIQKHIAMLVDNEDWQAVYNTLSTSIENMYKVHNK